MRAYLINLDRAPERWAHVQQAFAGTQFDLCRVAAVDGNELKFPLKQYAEGLYHWFHGRPTNPRHVGCYLSHVRVWETFLATGDEHALVVEDDVILRADFETVLEAAMRHRAHWNVLRLTGLGTGQSVVVKGLGGGYSLCVSFGRMKGTGAYVLDRAAAKAWVAALVPMRLPIDHAVDREWFQGLRAACVLPFPASQTESGFRSMIQVGKSLKLPAWRRWVATYPYQIFNEATRWLFRAVSFLKMKVATLR